jgi:hypothetical protein
LPPGEGHHEKRSYRRRSYRVAGWLHDGGGTAAALTAAADECRRTTKTHFARAQCFNEADRRAFGENPLLAMKYATRLQLAVKIDKGELSEDEAQAQFAAAMAQLQMQAAAQQQAAMANFGNSLERAGWYLQQAGAPPAMPAPPPIPQQTRCSFWQNTAVCQ